MEGLGRKGGWQRKFSDDAMLAAVVPLISFGKEPSRRRSSFAIGKQVEKGGKKDFTEMELEKKILIK